MAIERISGDDSFQLRQLADDIAGAKRIVAITGAGISTSCGIPDFRTSDGLYKLIEEEYNSASKTSGEAATLRGKDLFDASVLKSEASTSVFYKFITKLRNKVRSPDVEPTKTHRFLATLRNRRKMIRTYTQNIDGLEKETGLKTDLTKGKGSKRRFMKKSVDLPGDVDVSRPDSDLYGGCEVVQLHGELDSLRCTLCGTVSSWDQDQSFEKNFLKGEAAACETCAQKDSNRRLRGCRGLSVGQLRPNIVLYGEEHPSADLIGPIVDGDISAQPDLLLIFGTSLKVHGLKVLVKQFANAVHARKNGKGKVVFVNLSEPSKSTWKGIIDRWVDLDCDTFTDHIREHRPDIFQGQGKLELLPAKKKVPKTPSKPRMEKLENTNGAPTPVTKSNKKRKQSSSEDNKENDDTDVLPAETSKRRIAPLKKTTAPTPRTPRRPLQPRVSEPVSPLRSKTETPPPSNKRRKTGRADFQIIVDEDEMPQNRARVEIPDSDGSINESSFWELFSSERVRRIW